MNVKKPLSLLVSLSLCAGLAVPALAEGEAAENTAQPWYAQAQDYVTGKGWMTGTGKGFEPDGVVSRASVYHVLWNMEGKTEAAAGGGSLSDVPEDAWYAPSARWALAEGLTQGTGSGTYDGGRSVTRAELATILYRYASYKRLDVSAGENVDLLTYADGSELQEKASWAVEAFRWACGSEIITGKTSGESLALDHAGTAIRAELAAMLMRFDALHAEAPQPDETVLTGKVTAVSKYGNVTTDIPASAFEQAGWAVGDMLTVRVAGQDGVDAPFGTAYSNVDNGQVIVLTDSGSGCIATAINMGNFSGTYQAVQGAEISYTLKEKEGYLEEYTIRNIDSLRTNDIADYGNDEAVFANFRAVALGDIAEGRLYRSSSPVNPELGRNAVADKLAREAGIRTVINLADDEETMKGYEGYAESYYAGLNVKPLNMGVDFADSEFNAKLKEGLEFLIENASTGAPFLIHCNEGKDRAGFVSALLECLGGAQLDEVVDDYMKSYENYYHVEYRSERWQRIAGSNIYKTLQSLAGVDSQEELARADLEQAAGTYLTETVGLTGEQVTALRDALTK